MSRAPIPTWCFALVVVVHEGRILLVQERKHGGGWYLPAGRVEPGERFVDGARRETLEESGVDVTLDGILRIEHRPAGDGARMRVFFRASPTRDPTPNSGAPRPNSIYDSNTWRDAKCLKSHADEHSLGAAWFTIDELAGLPLRGAEVIDWAKAVLVDNAITAPLSLLTDEGAAVRR